MTGINFCLIRQGEKLGLDTIDKRIKITAGQIGSADAAIKQYISADYKTAGFMIKRHTAGRMAGRKTDFQFLFANFNGISFFYINQWALIIVKRQLPQASPDCRCKIQYRFFFLMDMK